MNPDRLVIDAASANQTLSAVARRWKDVPWSTAKEWCARGKLTVNGVVERDPGARLGVGVVVELQLHARNLGPEGGAPDALYLDRARLIHCDPQIVIIDKPPGVNSVPFEVGERGALVDRVSAMLPKWKLAPAHAPLFVVHRLDRETSGLLVFGRTWVAKRHLAGLFRKHDVERVYVALVKGIMPTARRVETVILEDRGDGIRGSARGRTAPHIGQRAVTHVRPLMEFRKEEGVTLVECRLETGRQHQIRIHLSELGHPVLGDRVYARGRDDMPPAPRVMLHARTLGFVHPTRDNGEVVRYEAAVPDDMMAVARRLGFVGTWLPT
jgi:23S rRNA pseudouridine1911/1915/1917 synthase